jgi:hypothetical protein
MTIDHNKTSGGRENPLSYLQDPDKTPLVLHDMQVKDKSLPCKHFEGHGDSWQAVFSEGTEKIFSSLSQIIPESHLQGNWVRGKKGDADFAAFLLWPGPLPTGIGSLVAAAPENGNTVYVSSYPVFDGADVELSVKSIYSWGNEWEGEVTVVSNERTFTFFDCVYFKNKAQYSLDTSILFKLSALAYSLKPAKQQYVKLTGGTALYDAVKQEFLEHTPKNGDDFPPYIVVSCKGATLLTPKEYACLYEFRTPILSVEKIELSGTVLYKLSVDLSSDERHELPCFLYVAEHILNNYSPAIGDDVEGVCWLSGYPASIMLPME